MYTKKITYTDYDGNERNESFMFNLNRAELIEMNMNEKGGLDGVLRTIVAEEDTKRIYNLFKQIIRSSIGRKSPDGKMFIKNETIADEFEQSEAFSVLVVELLTDPTKASEFINNIVPKDVAEAAANAAAPTILPMA